MTKFRGKEKFFYEVVDVEPCNNQASFGGKAKAIVENGKVTLTSYNMPVAEVEGDTLTILPQADCSNTTSKHVKAFAHWHGVDLPKGMPVVGETYTVTCHPYGD